MTYSWNDRRVLVTGGASFIGSTIVDKLLARGAGRCVVADDFSSGVRSNIQAQLDAGAIDLIEGDLRDPDVTAAAVAGVDTIFHLAADHGGRGYVDLHQYAVPPTSVWMRCCSRRRSMPKVSSRSSTRRPGCIYPLYCRATSTRSLYLTEDMERPPGTTRTASTAWRRWPPNSRFAAMHTEYGMKTASCRYFTVYGPEGCREPRGDRDDRAGVPEARSVLRVGQRRADPELDLRR